jgi:4-amino-4-deoxy-L-arabinose transferase-like glycosyltransferase
MLVLGMFCLFLFFLGIGHIGLIGADEPRYAQIAREMLARGDWITPVLRGRPWLEKPVLYYWEAMVSYRLLGVSDWAARIPSAFDATVMIVAVYFILHRLRPALGTGNQEVGTVYSCAPLDAALITASTSFVLGFAHAASTDMPLTASFTIGMLAWIAWWQPSLPAAPFRFAPGTEAGRSRVWLLGFYLFMGLGTLAKGPVAPLLAGLIISLFAAIRRDGQLIRRTLWWPGMLLYLLIAAPWYVLVQLRTGVFFRAFLLEHNLERYNTALFGHQQPFWYFLPVTLAALAPWTVLAVAGFVQAIRQNAFPVSSFQFPEALSHAPSANSDAGNWKAETGNLSLFLALWGAVPVAFFSFSVSKLPGYILPAVPPFAILAALWLGGKRLTSAKIPPALLTLHGLLAGGTLSLVLLSPYMLLRLNPPKQALTVAAAAGIVFAGAILLGAVRFGVRALRFLTILPILAGLGFLLRVAAPQMDDQVSARQVAHEIVRLEPEKAPVAVTRVDRELEYGLGFYLNQPIARYERNGVPAGDHLLVSRSPLGEPEVSLPDRRLTMLGRYPAQQLALYWVEHK